MPQPRRKIWHEGEKYLHRVLDVEQKLESRGQAFIRDAMPDQHRLFFAQMRFIVLSALDGQGRPWPFLRSGGAGFVASPDAEHLTISSTALTGEPADLQLGPGDKISVLGIELETRRRNRMNGTISHVEGDTITISVDQSFGNCPRYIHVRGPSGQVSGDAGNQAVIDHRLNSNDIARIRIADMFFIASRAPVLGTDRRAGIDVNHRGGLAGFVKVLPDMTIVFPDYDGNKFFNTFGNILRDSRVGMMFPDFATGDLLTLNGRAEVVLDAPEREGEYGSTRFVRFNADCVLRAANAIPLRFALKKLSRNAPDPGTL